MQIVVVDEDTLQLIGAFDVRSTAQVRDSLARTLSSRTQAGSAPVVVDLTEVPVVDVTALKVLAVASRRAHHDGVRLRLRGCGPHVLRMLHISRLIRILDVERTPQASEQRAA